MRQWRLNEISPAGSSCGGCGSSCRSTSRVIIVTIQCSFIIAIHRIVSIADVASSLSGSALRARGCRSCKYTTTTVTAATAIQHCRKRPSPSSGIRSCGGGKGSSSGGSTAALACSRSGGAEVVHQHNIIFRLVENPVTPSLQPIAVFCVGVVAI